MSNGALGRIQRLFGRSRAATYVAVKLRNQCEEVIRYSICADNDASTNGEAWLIHNLPPTASTFVDVGANIGDWTAMFLQVLPHATGLLIEPSVAALAKLQQRFARNGNVRVIHAAGSSTPGQMEFFEEPDAGKTSSLVSSFADRSAAMKLVRVTTVDAEAELHGFTYIDVLKIDAEGFDFHVLQGARRMLSQQAVGVVQFEYNGPWAAAGSTLACAITFLESYSYQVYLLKPARLATIEYDKIGEFFGYANFVAVCPKLLPALAGP